MRIFLGNWLGEVWKEFLEEGGEKQIEAGFKHCGMLNKCDGSEDHLIKVTGIDDYTMGESDSAESEEESDSEEEGESSGPSEVEEDSVTHEDEEDSDAPEEGENGEEDAQEEQQENGSDKGRLKRTERDERWVSRARQLQ